MTLKGTVILLKFFLKVKYIGFLTTNKLILFPFNKEINIIHLWKYLKIFTI